MKAYKVVALGINSKLVSVNDSKFALTYELGVTSIPTIGKIFVFKNKCDALLFAKEVLLGPFDYSILEGEAEKCRPISRVAYSPTRIEAFWKAKKNHKRPYTISTTSPEGSYTCASFTPKKIVDCFMEERL